MQPIPAPEMKHHIRIPIPMPGPFGLGGGVAIQTNPVGYDMVLTGRVSDIHVYIKHLQDILTEALRTMPETPESRAL